MGTALADVLPLALGIAASPFPIIPAILLLFTPRAGTASRAFLGGWLIGVVVATGVFAALAGVIDQPDTPPTWASWTRIVLGVALVALGVRQWLGRRAAKETPGWMRSIETATPATAARLALLLSLANPKILLLAAAAGLSIGATELGTVALILVVAVFALFASATVAVPVVLYAVRGEKVLGPLSRAKDWLQDNNAAVMAVVFLVLGAMLVAKGIGGL